MTQKRKNTRKKVTKKTSMGKLTSGLLLVAVFGYGAIAIWEGKIDIGIFNNDEPSKFIDSSPDSTADNAVSRTELKVDLDSYDLYFTKAFDFAWPTYTTDQAVIEKALLYFKI